MRLIVDTIARTKSIPISRALRLPFSLSAALDGARFIAADVAGPSVAVEVVEAAEGAVGGPETLVVVL